MKSAWEESPGERDILFQLKGEKKVRKTLESIKKSIADLYSDEESQIGDENPLTEDIVGMATQELFNDLINLFSEEEDDIEEDDAFDLVEELFEQSQNIIEENTNNINEESIENINEESIEQSPNETSPSSSYLTNTSVLDSSAYSGINIDQTTFQDPIFWTVSSSSYESVTDVGWGYSNTIEENFSNGFGDHNLWVSGISTTPGSGSNIQAKLGIANRYGYYTGAVAQVLQNGSSTQTLANGLLTFGFDFGPSKRLRGIVFIPDHNMIVYTQQNGASVNENDYSSDIVVYSINSDNATSTSLGLYSDDFIQSALNGKYAGIAADSLFFEYEGIKDDDEFTYAVGLAKQSVTASSLASYTEISLRGYATGLLLDALEQPTLFQLADTSNDFVITGQSSFGIDVDSSDKSLGPIPFDKTSSNLSSFISKDGFITEIEQDGTFNFNGLSGISGINSYFSAVPGLADFSNLGWGIWGAKSSDGFQRFWGFASFGIDGNETSSADLITLAGLASPNNEIRYIGPAMGSVFNTGETPLLTMGSVVLNVNFTTGVMSGTITLNSDTINLSRSTAALIANYTGEATLNGGGSGYFRGAFFGSLAAETGGTFSVENGTRYAVGTYAGK